MTKRHHKWIGFIVGTGLALASSTALASEEELEAKIKYLGNKVQRLESALNEALEALNQATEQANNVSENAAKQVEAAIKDVKEKQTKGDVIVTMKPAPKVETADGSLSFQTFGRIQADAAWFDDDIADHPDGTTLRRARLGAKGKVGDDFGYKAEVDFANNDSTITDAYIHYNGIEHVELKVGQFKEPIGLDNLTSSKDILFLERASVSDLAPGRNIGLQASTAGEHWSLAAGVFGDDVGTSSTDDEQYSVTARATVAPVVNEQASVHLGAAGSFRAPDSATDSVQYRARPDSRLASLRSVDTGTITGVDDVTLLGLEAAAAWHAFFLQSEYTYANVSRDVGADIDLDGYYVQAAWTLTGETRPYDVKKGVYGRIKPRSPFNLKSGGIGAWEIAARYSNLDLNDGIAVAGGEMDTVAFGLNWYPNDFVRFMADYTLVDTDVNAVTPNDEPNILAVRGQVAF